MPYGLYCIFSLEHRILLVLLNQYISALLQRKHCNASRMVSREWYAEARNVVSK